MLKVKEWLAMKKAREEIKKSTTTLLGVRNHAQVLESLKEHFNKAIKEYIDTQKKV